MKRISIIIPCYNEEAGIPGLAEKLNHLSAVTPENKYSYELVFIDDGSTDGTNKILNETFGGNPDAKIVVHETNQGYGNAARTGFKASSGEIIVHYDSDCTTPVDDIPPMLDLMKEGVDIVSGSAFHPDGNTGKVLWYRRITSKTLIFIYKIILGGNARHITSFTLSFRAYRKNVIDSIDFKSGDFLAASEILILALLKGFKVVEFPTTLVNREYGVSKMKTLSTIFAHLKFILKILSGHEREKNK